MKTLEKIHEIYWKKIGWRIRFFFTSIENLIRWFPIIWKDRDWDGSFIYEILKFKIRNTSKYTKLRGIHESSSRNVEIMNLCSRLIDKIQSEDYVMEYHDYYDVKYDWEKFTGKTGYSELKETVISDNLEEYFKKHPRAYLNIMKAEKEMSGIGTALLMGYERHNKAKKLLFDLLNRNIDGWWE